MSSIVQAEQTPPGDPGTSPAAATSGGFGDLAFRGITTAAAVFLGLLVLAILVELTRHSTLSMRTFGLEFLTSQEWNAQAREGAGEYGAATSIFGTLVSTAIAMLVAVPLALLTAIFLVDLAPPWLARIVGVALELLAAVPSIIYGMWGAFVFAPFMAGYVQPALHSALGFLPFFAGRPDRASGMLITGLVLALMILPFICAVSRDVLRMIPPVLKESAYGLGATSWEVTRQVSLPYGSQGIIGATFLGLGRAIGETMAVTFIIGDGGRISLSLFDAGNTITSTLVNKFSEVEAGPTASAASLLKRSALLELGLILFVVTVLFQLLAYLWLRRLNQGSGVRR